MRVLVDTQVLLWLALEPAKLKDEAVTLLAAGTTERVFSAVSAWEMAIKWRLGKLPLPEPPKAWVDRLSRELVTTPLLVHFDHAVRVADLPDHHRDPFDRLLAAQALVEGLPLVTSDPMFDSYGVDVIPAK